MPEQTHTKRRVRRATPRRHPRVCVVCEKTYLVDKPSRKQIYCSHSCAWTVFGHKVLAAALTPESIAKNAAKKRGTGTGYVKINGRHEHRVVMERRLGRSLSSDEIVHHRDERKSNNNDDNLELTDRVTHARIHNTGRKRVKKTHCKYGHELTLDNVRGPLRRCIICARIYDAKWKRDQRKRRKQNENCPTRN